MLQLPDQTVQHEAGELVRDGGHQGRVLRPREHSCNTTQISYGKGVRWSHVIFTRAVVGDHPVAHKLQDQDEEPRVEREHPHLLLQSLHLAAGMVHSVFMSYHCRYKQQHIIIRVVYKHYYILCSVPRLQRQIVTEYRSPHSHQPATGQLLPLRHRRHTA